MNQIAAVMISLFIEIDQRSSLTFNLDLPYVANRAGSGALLGVYECRLEAI